MPKAELGTKRICPVTGKKFYDLGKDPIVSPYTGQSYPRSYFDPQPKLAKVEEADDEEIEVEGAGAELVPLEDADDADAAKAVPDEDIDLDDDEDDTFLAPEEDEDDNNVSDLIDGEIEEDEES